MTCLVALTEMFTALETHEDGQDARYAQAILETHIEERLGIFRQYLKLILKKVRVYLGKT